jgi:hypothetical protein
VKIGGYFRGVKCIFPNIIGDIIFYDSNMHCVTIFKCAIDFFFFFLFFLQHIIKNTIKIYLKF